MSHWHYQSCGLAIESDQPIDELAPQTPGVPDLVVLWNAHQLPPSESRWFREWRFQGKPFLSFARSEGGYLLRFRQADFWVSSEGSRVLCGAAPGTPEHTLRHLFLDQILPLALSRRGLAVFHASAVAVESGALAFAGPSGLGKSTMAAYFAGLGHPLITDDCLAIRTGSDTFDVAPAYPGVRLWRDSLQFLAPDAGELPAVAHYSDKSRYAGDDTFRFATAAVPLRRFYFLEPARDGIEIEPVPGAELMHQVMRCQFLLDSEDPWELQASFQVAAGLAHSGLCYRLAVPRDLTRLAECARRILAHAGELRPERVTTQ